MKRKKLRISKNRFLAYTDYLDSTKLLDNSEQSVLLKQAIWKQMVRRCAKDTSRKYRPNCESDRR